MKRFTYDNDDPVDVVRGDVRGDVQHAPPTSHRDGDSSVVTNVLLVIASMLVIVLVFA